MFLSIFSSLLVGKYISAIGIIIVYVAMLSVVIKNVRRNIRSFIVVIGTSYSILIGSILPILLKTLK